MKGIRGYLVRNLQAMVVWAAGALLAILLVEYNVLAGLAAALAAGIILGILLWR